MYWGLINFVIIYIMDKKYKLGIGINRDADAQTVSTQDEYRTNLTNIILLLKPHSGLMKNLEDIPIDNDTKIFEKMRIDFGTKIKEYNTIPPVGESRIVATPDTLHYPRFLRDAFIIKRYGFETFVGSCMSESKQGGWAADKRQVKFKVMTSYEKYDELLTQYEDLKSRRLRESNKSSISSKPNLLEDIWKLKPINEEFCESLKSFFTIPSNWISSNDKTIFGLLKLYAKYIHGKNIHNVFETTITELFKNASHEDKQTLRSITALRKTGSNTCKKLFCFALHYCMNLNPLETSGGGNFFGRRAEQQVVAIDQRNRSYWKKILVLTFSIMSFIYFTFLLFETFRLLNSTITRILDARVTYLALYGEGQERPEDTTFVGYMNSFLRVMYEVGAGNIIETLDSLTPSLMHEIQESLRTVATTATNDQYTNCADGIFGCINSFFSGELQAQVQAATEAAAMREIDLAILAARYKLQTKINDIKFTYRSGTRNLVTALHGISFSSILILYPASYTRDIVGVSAGSLMAAYTVNPLYGLYGLGGHLSLLMYPQVRGIGRLPIPAQADVRAQVQAPIPAQVEAPIRPVGPQAVVNNFRNFVDRVNPQLEQLERLLAQHSGEDSRGGKNRKTFKKRANKTVKKKYNKRKTSKNKTK